MRKIEPYLDPALAAYWRGSIWARAGETDIALAFFKRAEELAPQNGGYAYVWLDTLSRTNSGEALAIAEGLIHQPKDRPAELILKAAELVADDSLKADDKLTKIDALLPFPATASAEQLGELLGVSKQAILKTRWWADHRKGEKQDEIGRRAMAHRKRAEGQQTPDTTDDDGAW